MCSRLNVSPARLNQASSGSMFVVKAYFKPTCHGLEVGQALGHKPHTPNVLFLLVSSARYDFVEIEEPGENTILGRWCGSQSVPTNHISKGNQIRIRFISDEYFPSEPGFCIRYSLLPVVSSAHSSQDPRAESFVVLLLFFFLQGNNLRWCLNLSSSV